MNRADQGEQAESILEPLAQADQLITSGKIEEAFGIIQRRDRAEGLEELRWGIVESRCRNKRGEYKQVIEITEKIEVEIKKIEKLAEVKVEQTKRIRIDTLKEQIWALQRLGDLLKGLEKVEEGIRLMEELEELDKKEEDHKDKERKANLLNNKGVIHRQKGELDEALKLYKDCLAIKEEIGEKRGIALSLNNIGVIYNQKGELGKALEYWEKSLVIKEELGNKQEIASSLSNIGIIYHQKGEPNQALEYYEKSLALREELGNKSEIATSLNNIGILHRQKGELNPAVKCYRKCLLIYEELGNAKLIAGTLSNLGGINLQKGELGQALEYYEKSLVLREEIGNKQEIANSLNSIGGLYQEIGELEVAFDFFKQSLTLREEIGNKLEIAFSIFSLIGVSIDLDEVQQARDYLIDLQLINKQEENKRVDLCSRLAEALILKMSKRRKSLTTAEEILEEIVEEEIIIHDFTVQALINLSEILLEDLKTTGEEEILEEVQKKVEKLSEIAKEQQSYSLLTESYWLKAQLALIRLDLKETRSLLSQAQIIAEEKGLERLARKISSEHDQLLEQLDRWEELIAKDATIIERVKVANLEELMGWMARKREIKIDEKEDEPIMLMLVAKSGLPIYSKQFDETKELQDMLISGFLTSINTFVQQAFDVTGMIKRITHDEYTLSFDLKESILFCYVYDGQSYTAMKKLEKLIDEVYESDVWSALEEVGRKGYGLNQDERAQMEGVIGEIFLTN